MDFRLTARGLEGRKASSAALIQSEIMRPPGIIAREAP